MRCRDRTARLVPHLRLKIVEELLGEAARIGLALHDQRRHRADDRRTGHPLLAVPREVAHHLAAARRMPNVDRVAQIEVGHDGREIVGVVVHVEPVGHVRGAAVPAPVVRDHAVAVLEKEHHLRVPVVRRERPPMAEHDRLPRSPVLIEDLGAVVARDDARWRARATTRPHGVGAAPRANRTQQRGHVDFAKRRST